jgi:hypothetical protein
MFCTQCGYEVKVEQARFCSHCGAALNSAGEPVVPHVEDTCLVVCVEVGEKWSFFGKDVNVFRAVSENCPEETVIAQSKEFVVTGFSYEGPSKSNKLHAEAFEDLAGKLEKKGWKRDLQYGPHWFTIRFKK